MQKQQEPEINKEDERIKERIKLAITSKGIKLKQFARESGMAYPSLRDYYSGLRKPGFDAIATLLRFTGVSAEWLLLGNGHMFPNDETPLANVDEGLIGQIARIVEKNEVKAEEKDILQVHDRPDGDYLYSATAQALRERLQKAGTNGVITGSVYNRVANIPEEERRIEAIEREVQVLLRMHRSLNRVIPDYMDDNA